MHMHARVLKRKEQTVTPCTEVSPFCFHHRRFLVTVLRRSSSTACWLDGTCIMCAMACSLQPTAGHGSVCSSRGRPYSMCKNLSTALQQSHICGQSRVDLGDWRGEPVSSKSPEERSLEPHQEPHSLSYSYY